MGIALSETALRLVDGKNYEDYLYPSAAEFADPPDYEGPGGRSWLELERRGIDLDGFAVAPEAFQQLSPGDVKLGPALQLRVTGQGIEDDEPGGRALGHGEGNRSVGLHDGGGLVADQLGVEQRDLPPVGTAGAACGRVAGGDGGLQLIGPGPAFTQGSLEERLAFGDHARVPQAAILLLEQYQLAEIVAARRSAGVGQQQQREQPHRLGLPGEQADDAAGEPDGGVA